MDQADIARYRRRTLIEIARRRLKPGRGSTLSKLNRSVNVAWQDLSRVFICLPWAVVGGVATANYMPERTTADIDIVVLSGDAARASEQLLAAGFNKVGPLSIGGSSWLAADGTPLDVIEGREAWWPVAL